jgi:hypothetical protein
MQQLIRPFDYHVPADVRHVAEAARVLRIRETEVFEHAHAWWYQRDISPATLDRSFAGYLLRQRVPPWVRHYCRRVLNLAAVGRLDPRDFGVRSPTMNRLTHLEQFSSGLITLAGFVVYLLFFA